MFTLKFYKNLCQRINQKNRNARNASRASSDYYTYLFFKDKLIKEKGIIFGLNESGFQVLVFKYGFEGFLEFAEGDRVIAEPNI